MMVPREASCSRATEILVAGMMSGLRQELDSLPEQQRLVVWFCSCMDYSAAEVADIVQIEESMVCEVLERGVGLVRAGLARRKLLMDRMSIRSALASLAREHISPAATARILTLSSEMPAAHGDSTRKQMFPRNRVPAIKRASNNSGAA